MAQSIEKRQRTRKPALRDQPRVRALTLCICAALAQISEVFAHLQPFEQQELFRLLLKRVDISERRMVLEIRTARSASSFMFM